MAPPKDDGLRHNLTCFLSWCSTYHVGIECQDEIVESIQFLKQSEEIFSYREQSAIVAPSLCLTASNPTSSNPNGPRLCSSSSRDAPDMLEFNLVQANPLTFT